MPNFFFYSDAGDGLFLARRFQREGHRVRAYINETNAKDVYRGIIPLSNNPSPEKGEIVIFDMVKYGVQADEWRAKGFKVIGASRFADALELNRPAGTEMMRKIGIRTPETHVFQTLDPAKTFLSKQREEDKWYFKPSGNQPTASTWGALPSFLLEYLEEEYEGGQFELQREIKGTEISLEGWWDGKRWVHPFNSTVEDKKLMAGDLGPRTGCMVNVVWAYEDPRPLLAIKTIAKLAPYLEASGHVGPIDLNMILDEEGTPFGLEWSPRFGYDALQALCLLVQGDAGRQFADFAEGRLEAFDVRTDVYGMTLNVSVPPFPDSKHAKDARGTRLDKKLLGDPGVYLRDVMIE